MARRPPETLLWTFDPQDETAIPNARIALALMVCVRRLPGALPEHDFNELGAALAPVLAAHARLTRATVSAHLRARVGPQEAAGLPKTGSRGMLLDRSMQALLGEAFARSFPGFRVLFDRVQKGLEDFLVGQSFPADRNVDMLARLIDLPPPETALLRLATAFCYGSLTRSLFAFVDSQSRIVNAIEQLCDVRGAATIRMFGGSGPLARSCLLSALNAKRSRCDLEDLLRLSAAGECLLGTPFDDEQSMARAVLTPLKPPGAGQMLEWPHLRQQQALVTSALRAAIEKGEPGVNLLLYGPPGTGKTAFVRQLVAEVGGVGFVVDDTDSDGAEASRLERLESLRLAQTFAGQQARAVLVLDEAEDVFRSDHRHPGATLFKSPGESKAWVNSLLENNAQPVIWICNRVSQIDPAYLRRFSYCLEFPQTPQRLRRRIAEDRLGAAGCSQGLIDAVSAMPEVTPAALESAARFACLCAASGLGADTAVNRMIESQLKAAGSAAPPRTITQTTRFDLRYLSVRGHASPERVLDSLGRLGRDGAGATLLFSGPPGTGKTQLAGEMAARLGRRLVLRTASDINSKWYGESEGNVARMFRDCDPVSELLFLDEAEVLLGAREEAGHRADRAVTAEFLRWLEAFPGIFVCATNHAGAFDPALTRRFTFRLEFEPLRIDQRVDLYAELALGRRPAASPTEHPAPVDDAIRAGLARLDRLTPGDFANAARRIRALDLPPTAWLIELAAEHDAKRGAASTHIGFL